MLPMLRMKDPSVHPPRVENHLAIQAGRSAHLRVFPKGLVVSPVVIRPEGPPVVIRLVASPVAAFVEAEAALAAFTVAVSPAVVEASTVVAAVDN